MKMKQEDLAGKLPFAYAYQAKNKNGQYSLIVPCCPICGGEHYHGCNQEEIKRTTNHRDRALHCYRSPGMGPTEERCDSMGRGYILIVHAKPWRKEK